MRYVLVDLDGASREHLPTRGAVRMALEEIEADAPGSASELYVVTYDDGGVRQGEPERGDEVLARSQVVFSPALDWSDDESEEPPTELLVTAGASR